MAEMTQNDYQNDTLTFLWTGLEESKWDEFLYKARDSLRESYTSKKISWNIFYVIWGKLGELNL